MSGIKYLLDTNFILGLLKSTPEVLSMIIDLDVLAEECAYSAVTSGLSVRNEANEDGDIAIEITQLRPGEKLYEELLIGDNPLPTAHPRIMKAHEEFLPSSELAPRLQVLTDALQVNNVPDIRALLKELVPGYQPDGEVVDWVHLAQAAQMTQNAQLTQAAQLTQ